MKHQPPRLAKMILRWFTHAELAEEVEGDLDELFFQRTKDRSIFIARLCYWADVLHSIKPYRSTPRRNKFSDQPAG